MKDNIFLLLNQIDHQADGLKYGSGSEEEVERWKRAFQTRREEEEWRIGGKLHCPKRLAGCAAATVLLCVIAVGPVGRKAYAGMKTVVYSLSELLGMERDLSSYSTVVGRTVEKGGMAVTLNEVLIDNDCMLVSCTTTFEKALSGPLEEAERMPLMAICINGGQAQIGSSSETKILDEYTMVTCAQLELPSLDLSRELEVKLVFSSGDEKIGSFEFTVSGQELAMETNEVELHETCQLPDGTEIMFTKYTSNSLGQKIYFKTAADSLNYDISLKGGG